MAKNGAHRKGPFSSLLVIIAITVLVFWFLPKLIAILVTVVVLAVAVALVFHFGSKKLSDKSKSRK